MLPQNVIAIIKEYSKPLTRPDWKTKPKMTLKEFYNNILKHMYDDQYNSIKTFRYLPSRSIVNMLSFVLNEKSITNIKFYVNIYGPEYIINAYNISPDIIYTLHSLSFMYNRN